SDVCSSDLSRLHRQTLSVAGLVLFPLIHRGRAGTHKTHIAFEHIPELGKLINGCPADESANALNDSGIVLQLEHQAAHLILFHQLALSLLRIQIHASELVNLEHFTILSNPGLSKENRTGGSQVNKRSHTDGCGCCN